MTDAAPAHPDPWRGVELLERAIGYTRGCLAFVRPELLTRPTPCAGWDLADLLWHMDDSLTSLHEAATVRRLGLVAWSPGATDPVERLRRRACQLLSDWAAHEESPTAAVEVVVAGRPLTTSVLTSAGALEVTVHGWDVASACGVNRPIPDELARDLLRLAPVLVTDADRPTRFGPALAAPGDADAAGRLLAHVGRRGDPTTR